MEVDDKIDLVVKSPYPALPDVEVSCNIYWTIGRLKEHLFQIYPGNPEIKQQRIIYMGKLLKDHQTISHMLNEENNSQPTSNIIHLVCPIKTATTESNHTNQYKARMKSGNIPASSNETITIPSVAPQSYFLTSPNDLYSYYWYMVAWQQQYMEHLNAWQQSFVQRGVPNVEGPATVARSTDLRARGGATEHAPAWLLRKIRHYLILAGLQILMLALLTILQAYDEN